MDNVSGWQGALSDAEKRGDHAQAAHARAELARARQQEAARNPRPSDAHTGYNAGSVSVSSSSTSSTSSRQETGNRRDYWESKVSPQAKEVCRLLKIDWWDHMPHSSPHLTEGTGQGGKAGHEGRDAGIMDELRQNVAAIVQRRIGVEGNLGWGQMHQYLKQAETKEEKEERKDSEKESGLAQAHFTQQAEQAKSAKIGDREQKAAVRDQRKAEERQAKEQAEQQEYKAYKKVAIKADSEGFKKWKQFIQTHQRRPANINEFNNFDPAAVKKSAKKK